MVSEKESFEDRSARDHRELATEGWKSALPFSAEKISEVRKNPELSRAAKPILKGLVYGMGSAAGIPTALFLFGEGLVGVHNAWRAHRLLREAGSDEDVQMILTEFQSRIDSLPEEKAEKALQALLARYGE